MQSYPQAERGEQLVLNRWDGLGLASLGQRTILPASGGERAAPA